MSKVAKRTSKSTGRPDPTPDTDAAAVELDALLLAVASHRVDREGSENEMAEALVRHLARRVAPLATPVSLIETLSAAMAEVSMAGGDLLYDVHARAKAADCPDSTAASMAGSVVYSVREIGRALLLGADELERLAAMLGWSGE